MKTMRVQQMTALSEVHRIVIAKAILKCYHDGMSWDFGA